MAEKKVQLSKKDRLSVALRSTFLQGSWNYERMQNGGWCFAMIPAIKKLYTTKEDQIAALKRHLEFFNTHPYVASPVIGVTLALEEDKANGECNSLGIHVVYTGIWLQCRNKDHRRLIRWITSESNKRSIYPWYVRPWCLDRTLGKYQLYTCSI